MHMLPFASTFLLKWLELSVKNGGARHGSDVIGIPYAKLAMKNSNALPEAPSSPLPVFRALAAR